MGTAQGIQSPDADHQLFLPVRRGQQGIELRLPGRGVSGAGGQLFQIERPPEQGGEGIGQHHQLADVTSLGGQGGLHLLRVPDLAPQGQGRVEEDAPEQGQPDAGLAVRDGERGRILEGEGDGPLGLGTLLLLP